MATHSTIMIHFAIDDRRVVNVMIMNQNVYVIVIQLVLHILISDYS